MSSTTATADRQTSSAPEPETPYESPEWHPAFEEYCETIFELAEDDLDVIQARIADRLDISRPAVSEMIRKMQTEGLVKKGRGTIKLTTAGHSLAETVVRRHRHRRMLPDRRARAVVGRRSPGSRQMGTHHLASSRASHAQGA